MRLATRHREVKEQRAAFRRPRSGQSRAALVQLCILFLASGQAEAAVPPPSETPAQVIVSGRTSTAVNIRVAELDQEIPKTYAEAKIHNTAGFRFYASEHYALKSNRGDDYSRHMLEVAELAYPHWVALVGSEPPDPDTRMYFVCADSADTMVQAMIDDVGAGPAPNFGGGITIWANRSAYNYPSGTLMYHQRALVIHENLHMLNLIVNGTGGVEGMTYSGEQHVYDPVRKQLTVLCFDKPTSNNYTDAGLEQLQKDLIPFPDAAQKLWDAGGGPGVIYTQFFLTNPDRYFKWCIWRDQLYAGRVNRDTNVRLMEEIFGPLDRLNLEWSKWVAQRRSSFHFVDWGWEQEGDALVAYGFPWDGQYFSQTNINYAPGESVVYDPLRMDYPAQPMPPTVGPVKRGVAEPSVGYVIDFCRSPGCWGGLGLGVDGRSMCQVVLAQERTLVIDGDGLGIARREVPITDEVRTAATADAHKFGVTVQIKREELEIVVRAGPSGALAAMTVLQPIDAAQRDRLLSRNLAVIGRDGYPAITPFIDDARERPPDLTRPAPPNRWRFAGEKELYGLYRAIWRLRELTPPSLRQLREEMVAAVDREPLVQQAAIDRYKEKVESVVRDVLRVSRSDLAMAAAADILGISLQVEIDPEATSERPMLTAILRAGGTSDVQGSVALTTQPGGCLGILPESQPVHVAAGTQQRVRWSWNAASGASGPATVEAVAAVTCAGSRLIVHDIRAMRPSIPCWWVIGPFDNQGDGTVDTPQPVEAGPPDLTRSYRGLTGREVRWQKCLRSGQTKLADEYVVDLGAICGGENASAYAVTWIVSAREQDAILAIGSDDGVVVWLNGERVHSHLVTRGYSPMADRVPIHLTTGWNQLLVKVTQGNGGWAMGAQVLDAEGSPKMDLSYALRD